MVIITEQGEWKPTQEEIIAMALGIDPRKEKEKLKNEYSF